MNRKMLIAGCWLLLNTAVFSAPLRVATLFPDSSRVMKELKMTAKSIEQQTAGKVQFKFYPGGVMGEDSVVLDKVASDTLDGGIVTGGALSRYDPDALLYHLPLQFRDAAEASAARAAFDAELIRDLSAAGLETLGIADGGFAQIFSLKPVRTPADLQAQKLWTPGSDMILNIARTLQLQPVLLPMNEVRNGLGDGRLDAAITTPMGALAQQWHTRAKCRTDLPFFYLNLIFVVAKSDFDKLDAASRQIVREQFGESMSRISGLNHDFNQQSLDVMEKRGIERITPDAAELEQWHAWSANVADRLAEKDMLHHESLERLNHLLEELRNKP